MTRSPISHAPMESPIGRLWVSVSPRGLVAISRGEAPDADLPGPAASDPVAAGSAMAELAAYFAGQLRTFSLALDLEGVGRFDAAVWDAARGIPFGATASYGELAAMAGYPRAGRAAGGSMSRCRVSPVVPCHRVIHADGSIDGWGADTWVKRWLLDHERASSASSMP
ncbi:MAG: methylated-DNA--[protein]-cysteine S-methyltransferase [Chloroflexota bacterium]